MTDDQHTAAVRDAGLTGWTAAIHPDQRRGRLFAVLISPDFNPEEGTGRFIAMTGDDEADAFDRALKAAKGNTH